MGRRRWTITTLATLLLFVIRRGQCQDGGDFYYTPERNFAQVQPPIFPNNRQSSFFEQDSFRISPTAQQTNFNDGRVRFPTPNYNQNPSPFQLPTGRSQAGTQFYINQPEFPNSQRQRFRPALPYNFQLVHPASTKKPDTSQIHSVAYQHDPSKPETFLGQITINNPDIEILQSNRFKNIPFDGNSLKSNGQSGHISHDDEIDNDDRDIFDHHKVTTYNPTKIGNRQMIIKPSTSRFSHFNKPTANLKPEVPVHLNNNYDDDSHIKHEKLSTIYRGSTTEYKSLLDIEPLLEDDISDLSSFRELMKNKQGSFDVEVIKSNNTSKDSDDSKPDATSMHSENVPKLSSVMTVTIPSNKTKPPPESLSSTESTYDTNDDDLKNGDGGEEEYEYYEDEEVSDIKQTTPKPLVESTSEAITDIYDEYDSTEEEDKSTESIENKVNTTKSFDILDMKPNQTMMQEDNFKHFVDTTLIDQTDITNDTTAPSLKLSFSNEDLSSIEPPSILGQEVVSVVTTKSVVNGTISIPDFTYPPTPKTSDVSFPINNITDSTNNETGITTESWIVVASVQTSRSVSGARFLPFPTVEQEEKKQVIADDEEIDEIVTENPRPDTINNSSSTENINDKLDSIQSELSSAVLSGNLHNEDKNIELITETTSEPTMTSSSTTPPPVNVFTLKSTQFTPITERSSPEPLPVLIKKFTPRVAVATTPKPKKKPSFVTIMDDLSGLLPPGFKSRQSYKDKRTSTTSTTTSTTTTTQKTTSVGTPTDNIIINGTQGRSSGISSKNKVIILDDKSLLPKEYKPKEKVQDDLLKKIQKDDLSKLLPPGYKPPLNEDKENSKPDIFGKIETIDITAFLPKGFKLNTTSPPVTTSTEKPKSNLKIPLSASPVDITALLPPGFKLNATEKEETVLNKVVFADVSNLLPPGYNLNSSEEPLDPTTTKSPGSYKVVFPSRPGGKTTRKPSTQRSSIGPPPVTPKIQKGWPTRASTEFTGWPSPSTTPISIERLLEIQRNATSTSQLPEISTESTTKRYIPTTTTTQAPPSSTTPGVCRRECDIAATIKIVEGVKWVPELLDQHTKEWQNLAKEVKDELNSVYTKSDLLRKWYKGIRIDGFSQGSVLVDFFIELNNVEEKLDTMELKKMFHKSLHEAKAGSVMESLEPEPKFDPDVMQGDQPEEERTGKSNKQMTKTIDKSAGKLEIGKFVMDPAYTEFIVLPKRGEPTVVVSEEESLLPQWGIAVIVIAMASLLFVVIFGVTVLVNRQKSTKTKQPIPLSEDMLRELDKSHMGGFDDLHQMKERDLPYLPSGKRMSTAFIEQLAYPNPGDSWRSEWTPQVQKYMQHYTADSGRGSQIYGATGNGYGYTGSQIYGQTGGSQVYGYTGEYPRSHYSRRRSEYDSNF